MKLLADENIPYIKELFSDIADITQIDGRAICQQDLIDKDILLVRSVTSVNKQLLQDTSVKFVGTATIGTDHLDTHYLEANDIAFANAPGCNAIAVAEYILSSLFILAKEQKVDLRHTKVAIVGAGNVGTAVGERLEHLAIPFGYYDPPLEARGSDKSFMTEQELEACDIVSLHVPLTTELESKYPTLNLVDDEFFSAMTNMSMLINTSRGKVIDDQALKRWLAADTKHQVILDVWDNEPGIDQELVERAFIATPHIAGHSFEGKVRGSLMLHDAVCEVFNIEAAVDAFQFLNKNRPKDIIHVDQGLSFMKAISSVLLKVYNVRDDDKALRAGMARNIAEHFDRLRKGYKNRREYSVYRLDPITLPAGARTALTSIGFKLTDEVVGD